jgi:DNA polymerase I-like protein with 3'-5' exonuclease and polymerase domains
MNSALGDPIWDNNAKNERLCADCPKCKAPCVLVGRKSHTQKYSLIFLFETPDRDACEETVEKDDINLAFNGNPRNFLDIITKRLKDQIDMKIDPSTVFAVGAYYHKDPDKQAIESCSSYVHAKILDAHRRSKAERSVIVPFGRTACRSLNLKMRKISDARGKPTKVRISNETFHVIPTLSLRQCMAKQNYFDLVLRDIIVALESVFEDQPLVSAADFSKQYEFPETAGEVGALCDRIIEYTGNPAVHPDKWPISIDLETTGLMPWAPNARIIALSVAWDKGKAAAIILDHKDNPYDTAKIWEHVRRLVESKKPKIYHNAKFDLMWLNAIGGCNIDSVWWDTMLGEHFINEDAKGFYSLKRILLNYAPQFAGYEDQLWTIINESEQKDLGSLLRYVRAPDSLLKEVPELKAMEDEYLELTLSVHASKHDIIDEERAAERRLEVDTMKKRRGKLRQSIRKVYLNGKLVVPESAKLVVGKKDEVNDGSFELVPLDVLALYAAIDADLTRRCCKGQRQRMRSEGRQKDGERVMATLYIPATRSLTRMQLGGIRINQYLLEQWVAELDVQCKEAEGLIRAHILKDDSIKFNPNSSDDIARVLVEVLGVPYSALPQTPTGKMSTKAELIESLGKKNPGTKIAQFCYYTLLYRAAQKAKSTYLGGIHKLSVHDGRIHTNLKLNGTTTGRLSSSQPNFQNLPGGYLCRMEYHDGDGALIHSCPGWPIKRLLIPSSDEYALFDMDVSAAEIRVLCGVARDESLIKAVNDGLDVPSFIASEGFTSDILQHCQGTPEWERVQQGSSPKAEAYKLVQRLRDSDSHLAFLRTAAKRVLYGTLYGAGPSKIAEQIYGVLSRDVYEADRQIGFAKSVQRKFFALFPSVEKWIKGVKRNIRRHKKVRSIFGRYRHFPLAISNFSRLRSEAEREGVNFCIQGPASDLVLSQLCEIEVELPNIGGRLMLTVHDSVVGEIKKENIPLLKDFFDYWMIHRVAERFPWLPVPYRYGLDVGMSYKDTVPYDKYISEEDLTEEEAHIIAALKNKEVA